MQPLMGGRPPVRHEMSLRPGPFAKIASGMKRYELRLMDEKRRTIGVGDEILFTRTTDGATLLTHVTSLHPFRDFGELYATMPMAECGYTAENAASADPRDMDAYYPPEKQRKYGVLAIGIELVRLDVRGFSSSGMSVRMLNEQDIPSLLELALGNPLYYEHMRMQPDEANLLEAMHALPPRKTEADKYFFGWFDGLKLVAVMDLITGHPSIDTAFIGWFIVCADCQGRGLGAALIEDTLAQLKKAGFSQVRLGRIVGNPQSEGFWKKCDFSDTAMSYDTDGYTVRVMERTLL